jgi:rubrerythrin
MLSVASQHILRPVTEHRDDIGHGISLHFLRAFMRKTKPGGNAGPPDTREHSSRPRSRFRGLAGPRGQHRRAAHPRLEFGAPPMTDLTDAEIRALHEALDDEYKAWTTYDQVIADFGGVAPFRHIREAEARHIAALRTLFARYGLAEPENPWPGRVPRFATVAEACAAAVAAEVENAALYQRLLAATQRPDILGVFRRLQAASQERHLRAFERCAQGLGGGGGGGYRWGRSGGRWDGR